MEAVVEGTTTTTIVSGNGDAGGSKDPTNIIKGKRTKRQRLQSPIPFTISSNNDNDNDSGYSFISSSGFPADSTTTEDEDTARCLILLSRGESLSLRKNKEDDEFSMYKFNSKRYIQMSPNDASGKAGVFVYECKTCSRTFPSFQALGGHRASHRKPKNNEDMRKPPPYMVVSENNEPPPQLNNRVAVIGNITKPSFKLHECSICGTEFNSGQALGGHMRRHRVAGGGNKGENSNATAATTKNTATLSLVPFNPVTTVEVYDQHNKKSKNDGLCLDLGLDLNIPAPPEATAATGNHDQRQEGSFTLSPAGENQKKQRGVHFSAAPTLVDCP